MRNQGIIRGIDPLGRIVIPMEIRRTLKIEDSDLMEITVEGGRINLTPCKLQCVACGSIKESELKQVRGVHLCPKCISEFGGKSK